MTARRVIVLLALIVLGAVAARDLDVRYEPDLMMPEVHVRLALPASLSLQPGDVASRWAVPVEAAIRAVGGTEAIAGDVSTTGLDLTARFAAGTDVETKTARIQSELEPLRKSLPEDAFLDVSAATFESATYLVLTGELQSTRVREIERTIERLPSVRSVRSYGSRPVETSIEVASSASLEEGLLRRIEGEVADIGRVSRLGETRLGGKRVPVYIEGARRLKDVTIDMGSGLATLDSLATIRKRNGERTSGGRYDGQQAVVLGLQRDPDVPLLRFDRELKARLDLIRASLPVTSSIEVLQSEADPLRRLLRRFGVGVAIAIVVLAMAGWLSGGRAGLSAGILGVPAALSLALHAVRFMGLPLDVTTIPVLATGLVLPGVLLLLPNRSRLTAGWMLLMISCALALPVAVAFAAGPFTTMLIAPAKVFAVAMSSVAACLLLFPPIESSMRPGIVSRRLRSVLRGAPTVLLVVATLCYSLLTMFGKGLDPRKGNVVPDRGRIFVTASLPEGTTLEQAEDGAARLEEKIGLVDGVDLVWGRVTPDRVFLVVEVAPDRQSEEGVDELSSEIRYRAGLPFGHVIVRPGSSGSSGGIQALEIEPEANDDGLYNLVIEGDGIGEIESAIASIESIAFGVNRLIHVTPEWGTRSVRVELRPIGPNAEIRTREIATAIADRVSPPRERAFGADEVAIVRSFGTAGEWVAPSRAEVLDAPLHGLTRALVPSAFLEAQEEVVAPRVWRQGGRFAVRVLVQPSGSVDLDHWLTVRKEVDQRLSGLTFDGVDMKRPEIRPLRFSEDAVRLIGMASVIPGMILLIAVIWSNSLWRFFPFVLPPALAVAAAAPTSRVAATGIDELSLLMLAGVCLAVLAVSLASGERIMRSSRVVGDGYRVVVATAIPMAGAALACGSVLIGSTLGTDAARDPWILGSRISGVAALVTLPSALLLPVSALYALEAIRRRRTPEVRARRRPAEWAEAGKISLDVRHVSKVYRAGFRALRDVSFRLEPGVIGLLGPNGAGKTTLLRVLTGLLLPSRGQVLYRGHPVTPANIDAYREHIGFLPQSFNAYPGFTAEEFIDFWALEAGINDPNLREEEVDLLITAVGLEEHKRRRVRDFSGGMRQRIGIARALIAQPELLVVDEPTTGLDIEGRSRFRGLMLSIAAHRVVILSTHIAGDVEATCSRVLLLHRGQLRFDGAPEDLIAKAEGRVFEMTVDDHDVREIAHRYRLTKRVRVIDGIRVKGVVPTGEVLPGPAATPGLEEAYLAEIDLADVAVGRKAKFTFLFSEA